MGADLNEGRLQICDNGIWKAVTSYYWDYYDAEVACRQLYRFQVASTKVTWKQVYYTGIKFHVGFRCRGSENRLQECSYRTTNRIYYNNIYLRCQLTHSRETCRHQQIRLVGGPVNEGRLEVCLQSKWGSVCRSSWGAAESGIACEQLGFRSANSTLLSGTKYGDGNLPILMSSLNCIRQENLFDCSRSGSNHIGYHSCSTLNANAVALRCDGSTCSHGDVRLYGGYVSWEGFPEVCINGQWMGTCALNWDSGDSNIFCRQLLNQQTNIRVTQQLPLYYQHYPTARNWISNVACLSRPTTARFTRDCSFTTNNVSCSAIVVGCFNDTNCFNGSVRLLTLPNSAKKVVEVCNDGIWGSITSSSWGNTEARVVCRQLQQPWQKSVAAKSDRQSSFFWHRAYCVGTEYSILNCRFSRTYSNFSTSRIFAISHYTAAAAVICRGNQANNIGVCNQGDVRLINNITQTSRFIQGRVEICDNDQWVGICSNNLGNILTRLICQKVLGKPPKAYWTKYYKENGTSRFLISGNSIFCPRWATIVFNCSVSYNFYSSCSTTSTAGVMCMDWIYKVKVIPLNTSQIYTIGGTGHFNCNITPNPYNIDQAVTLRYYWYLELSGLTRVSDSSNISILFNPGYPKFNKIRCEVRANGIAISSGHYLIEVKDAVQVASYYVDVIDGGASLEVNLTSGDVLNEYLSKLVWYYNNYPIFSTTRLNNLGHNTTYSTSQYQDGEYRVRYEGLLVIPYNKKCEKALLDSLCYYPTFRPATFNKMDQDKLLSISSNLKNDYGMQIHFTTEDIVNITVVVDLSELFDNSFWEFAVRVRSNLNNQLYYQRINTKYWTHTVSIASGLPTDAGLYEIVLFSLYSTEFTSDCSSYYNYIRSSPFSLYSIIRDKVSVQLNYYENLIHTFNAVRMDYYLSERNQLTCYGNVDTPQFSRLFIEKHGISLKASESNEVQFSTRDANQFGLYKCIMVAEDITFEQTVFLRNKVDVSIKLVMDVSRTCQENQKFTDNLLNNIIEFLNTICSCNVTLHDFTDTTIKCINDAMETIQLSTTFAYSNSNGAITAASVMAQVSFLVLSSSKGLQISNNTSIISITYSHGDRSSREVGIGMGAFFSGIVLATICYSVILILYCVWKHKSSGAHLHFSATVKESRYESKPRKDKGTMGSKKSPREYEVAMKTKSKNLNASIDHHDETLEQPMYESVEGIHQDIALSANVVYGEVDH